MMTNNSDHFMRVIQGLHRCEDSGDNEQGPHIRKKDFPLVNNVTCSHAFCISSPLSLLILVHSL